MNILLVFVHLETQHEHIAVIIDKCMFDLE